MVRLTIPFHVEHLGRLDFWLDEKAGKVSRRTSTLTILALFGQPSTCPMELALSSLDILGKLSGQHLFVMG